VLVTPSDLFAYPDVTVVCGQDEFLDRERDTLLNPTLIIEVLSNDTEAYDRGLKFKLYRALPSLKQYLLISSRDVGVDLFTRGSDEQWRLTGYDQLDDTVQLTSIDCQLRLADIYEKVDFTP
jgi:Uma2 family endonuclease